MEAAAVWPEQNPRRRRRRKKKDSPVVVFGGGKLANVFSWRDKKLSGGILGEATVMWVLSELLEYYLLTLVAHLLIVVLLVVQCFKFSLHPRFQIFKFQRSRLHRLSPQLHLRSTGILLSSGI
ncbi:hypothetical protein RchiOBHm_Chr2g0112901 [Rosa chinensis]|uniref:Reticulon-like protein n=1 Tax=Rosa chinensis TaxID=74649 RepID=A0A2P6RQH3_ROSCH|nr:hypothetical protein RchiOBHm_Chr2g0112901 [Rosa chinensis]